MANGSVSSNGNVTGRCAARRHHLVRLAGGNGGEGVARDLAGSGLGKARHDDHVLEAGDRSDVLAHFGDHLLDEIRASYLRV